MSKLICYSLFNNPANEKFEKMAYVRGFYWNARMNNFLYPDWRTHLEVQEELYLEFQELFDWLVENNNLDLVVNKYGRPQLCEGMLWRMKPIWTIDVSHILCRDTDAITTYKEAQYIQDWIESCKTVSAIHDNPAHSGLMGGMVGFETAGFKALTQYDSWRGMIDGYEFDLSVRGSDQHLLNKLSSKLLTETIVYNPQWTQPRFSVPQVDPKLWESNLVCRHIGSAGVVEMEILRFFKRFDEYNWKFQVIEKKYPNLFYWQL